MCVTVIQASNKQIEKLLNKHIKPFLGLIPKIISSSYEYDSDDEIGFVTLQTITGKTIAYQLRGSEPCFVEFEGFGDIRYEVAYPLTRSEEMYHYLRRYGMKAMRKFWKGGKI